MTYIPEITEVSASSLGMPTVSRAVTATLYVSPDGDGTDGSTWLKAYWYEHSKNGYQNNKFEIEAREAE